MLSLDQFTAGRNLHPDLLAVLQGLSEKYGDDLHFLSRDLKWINFRVHGMSDEELLKDLEANQDDLFEDISDFQVLRPWGQSKDRGVFIHHLCTPLLRGEYLSGFWYY